MKKILTFVNALKNNGTIESEDKLLYKYWFSSKKTSIDIIENAFKNK